jgi:hypothetical protein
MTTQRRINNVLQGIKEIKGMKKDKLYKRVWLNKKEGTAFIEIREDWGDNNYDVKIADCSRQITLDLGFHNKETKRNALHKLNILVSELQALKTKIEETEI